MADSDFLPALPVSGQANKALLRDALVKRVIYPFFDGENPTAWVANVNGAVPAAIANSSGGIFFFDPTDTTTAHDGVVCIVTFDGYRYKTSNMVMPDYVLGIGVDEPTGSENIGDAYIVSSSPDGEFAYWPDMIAVLTVRGWLAITPRIGRPIFVLGDRHYFMDENGDWLPVFLPQGGQIRDQALVGGQRRYIVENQTTNAPPGSPAHGVYWIVGSAPTGAWAGYGGYIATWYSGDSAWTLIQPKIGDEAYDKATNANYIRNGSAWIFAGGAWATIHHVATSGTGSTTAAGSGSGWNHATSAPTTSQVHRMDDAGITLQVLSGTKIKFTYEADVNITNGSIAAGGQSLGIALFRDSDANAIKWARWVPRIDANPNNTVSDRMQAVFIIDASDSASHTYKVAAMGSYAGANQFSAVTEMRNRDFLAEVAS